MNRMNAQQNQFQYEYEDHYADSAQRLNPQKSVQIQMSHVQQPADVEAFEYEFFVPENLDQMADDFNQFDDGFEGMLMN